MSESDERLALAAFFKPVAGGFVYRAPSGWRLWRRRGFLVDAALRARLIAASVESVWVVVLWIVVPWLVVSGAGTIAVAFHFGDSPGHALAVFAAGLVVAFAGFVVGLAALAEHKWRRVAPLLREAEPTDERISAREMAAALRAVGGPSRRALFTQVLVGALLLALGVFNLATSLAGFGRRGEAAWPLLISGAVMAACGFAVLYTAARNLANRKD